MIVNRLLCKAEGKRMQTKLDIQLGSLGKETLSTINDFLLPERFVPNISELMVPSDYDPQWFSQLWNATISWLENWYLPNTSTHQAPSSQSWKHGRLRVEVIKTPVTVVSIADVDEHNEKCGSDPCFINKQVTAINRWGQGNEDGTINVLYGKRNKLSQ